jgi:DNA-binding NarL/FixJ family response regulator
MRDSTRIRIQLELSGELGELSPREFDVMVLVGAGMTNRAIAAHIGIAYQTVKNYLSAAYQKLGAHDRASALAAFHERYG